MLKSLLVFTLFLASVQAWDGEKCPKLIGKKPFDNSKFVGQWYVVYATVPDKYAGKEMKCIKFDILSQRTDGQLSIREEVTYKLDDEAQTGETFLQPKKSDDIGVFYGVHKLQDAKQWSPVFESAVIATDYDNYAAFVVCTTVFDPETKSFGRQLYTRISSRTPTLDPVVLDTLKNVLSGYNINVSKLKAITHDNC